MRRVCIVGVGLIGGSLGLALRRRSLRGRYRVTGLVRDVRKAAAAGAKRSVDELTDDPSAAIPQADVVVFCVPVQSIVPLARKFAPLFKRGALVTDAGSVKGPVVKGLRSALKSRRDVLVAGAHPMAGSENAGAKNAKADLFDGATCVLTSPAVPAALSAAKRLWSDAGARCVVLPAAKHDELVALTSHLPHLIAFSLFALVNGKGTSGPIRQVAATSFRDMTRVAASDPDIWNGIFDLNRPSVGRALDAFVAAARSLQRRKGAGLRAALASLSKAKKAWRP